MSTTIYTREYFVIYYRTVVPEQLLGLRESFESELESLYVEERRLRTIRAQVESALVEAEAGITWGNPEYALYANIVNSLRTSLHASATEHREVERRIQNRNRQVWAIGEVSREICRAEV